MKGIRNYLLVLMICLGCIYGICPNNCSGHGKCVDSKCVCFFDSESGDSYSGNDCSYHNCAKGNPFGAVNNYNSVDSNGGVTRRNRELEEISDVKKERKLAEGSVIEKEISLIGDAAITSDDKSALWKVSGLESFTSTMPKSGGIITCDFHKDGVDTATKDIDVRGFTNSYAYVLFGEKVTKIGNTPSTAPVNRRLAEGDGVYSKVVCKKVESSRKDLVHYNFKDGFKVPAGSGSRERQLFNNSRKLAAEDGIMTWSGYGPILYDMGLLPDIKPTETPKPEPDGGDNQPPVIPPEEGGNEGGLNPPDEGATTGRRRRRVMQGDSKVVYKSDKFKFGCFIKSSTGDVVTTKTEIVILDGITGEYDTSTNDVVFSFTDKVSGLTAGNYVCYCLMDSNGKGIDIMKTDLKDNIRKNGDTNNYLFGKYKIIDDDGTITEDYENGHIVIKTKGLTTAGIVTGAADYSKKGYLVKDRVVYLTVLDISNYSFKEIGGVMGDSYKIPENIDGIILPYIRTYPNYPSSGFPTPIISETITSGSANAPYVYKVVYFADNIISGLNAAGGIIKCLNTDNNEEVLINVKGVLKDGNYPIYSLIESEKEITAEILTKLNCYGIHQKRQDLSLTNPSTLTVGTRERRLLTTDTITWTGYGEILSALTKKDNSKFACYLPSDLSQQIIEIEITAINNPTESGNVVFTVTTDGLTNPGSYMCYLLAKVDGDALTIDKSDLFSLVRKGTTEDTKSKYYFGKFVVSDKVTIQKADDGSEVIPLDGATNKIEKSIITLAKIEENDKNVVISKLDVGNKFYLKLYRKDKFYEEIFEEYFVTEVKSETGNKRLLTEEATIISFTPDIKEGYTSDNVIYSSIPIQPISVVPTDEDNRLYMLSDFNKELLSELPSIGGKIQCTIVKSKVSENGEIKKSEFSSNVDVKGIYKVSDTTTNGYYQFDVKIEETPSDLPADNSDNHYYVDDIKCNRIISKRKDLTYWNPTKISTEDSITWTGYGEIANSVGINFNGKASIACYNPKPGENQLISFYEVTTTEIAEGVTDLQFTFGEPKPVEGNICYLLADKNGGIIEIENSELYSSNMISKDNSGNYYYGEYIDGSNNNNNKDESNTVEKGGMSSTINSDGSVKSKIDKDKIKLPGDGDNADSDKTKLDLSKSNDVNNPVILIPPSMIDISIQKVITSGTFVRVIIHYSTGRIDRIPTQILKVGKNEVSKKFILTLSNPITLAEKPTPPRLRSLEDVSQISSIDLEWTNEGSTHVAIECSGQGVCDGSSGICKCYSGYSGSACERLDCPNNCNGNGRCVALSELLGSDELENNYEGFGNKHVSILDNGGSVVFENQVFGCLCDKRHRGYDCSLIECPSGIDPETATNAAGLEYRDCSGRGICNYNTGICECFDGFSGEGCQLQSQTM